VSKRQSILCRLLIVKWEFQYKRFFCSLNININHSSISSARIEVFAPVRENFLVQEIQALESLETSRTNPWLSDQVSLHADPPLASTPRLAMKFSRLLSNGYMGLFIVAYSQQIQVPLSRGVRLPVPLWRNGVVFFTGKLFYVLPIFTLAIQSFFSCGDEMASKKRLLTVPC
jgi:hypothetical protein